MKVFNRPLHRATSHCSPLTNRRSFGDGILSPLSQSHVALLDLYEWQKLR